jgi:hypothetical protein
VALIEGESDGERKIEYAPIFRFQSDEGVSYTLQSNTKTNPPEFAVGDKITVLYDRGNPRDAKPDSPMQLWLIPMVFAIIGPIHVIIGLVLLYFDKQVRKRSAPRTAESAV